MKKIRIGNDICVTLRVKHDGEAADLTGRRLTVLLVNSYEREEITDFTVNGNVIAFVYKGTAQKKTGRYYVTLYENYGNDCQNVCDTYDAFMLVPRSTMIDDELCTHGTELVDVSMDVLLGTVNYNDLSELPSINGVTVKGDKSFKDYGIQAADVKGCVTDNTDQKISGKKTFTGGLRVEGKESSMLGKFDTDEIKIGHGNRCRIGSLNGNDFINYIEISPNADGSIKIMFQYDGNNQSVATFTPHNAQLGNKDLGMPLVKVGNYDVKIGFDSSNEDKPNIVVDGELVNIHGYVDVKDYDGKKHLHIDKTQTALSVGNGQNQLKLIGNVDGTSNIEVRTDKISVKTSGDTNFNYSEGGNINLFSENYTGDGKACYKGKEIVTKTDVVLKRDIKSPKRYVAGKFMKLNAPENIYVQAKAFINIMIPTNKRLMIIFSQDHKRTNWEYALSKAGNENVFGSRNDDTGMLHYDNSAAEVNYDIKKQALNVYAPANNGFENVLLAIYTYTTEEGVIGRYAVYDEDSGVIKIYEEYVNENVVLTSPRKKIDNGKITYSSIRIDSNDLDSLDDGYALFVSYRHKTCVPKWRDPNHVARHSRELMGTRFEFIKKRLIKLRKSIILNHKSEFNVASYFNIYYCKRVKNFKYPATHNFKMCGKLTKCFVQYDGEKFKMRI